MAKVAETLVIAETALACRKVEVRLYDDTPMCFLVITEDRLFVEHYHFAGRGGQNLIMAIKGKTGLFRTYEDHFDIVWRDAMEPTTARFPVIAASSSQVMIRP